MVYCGSLGPRGLRLQLPLRGFQAPSRVKLNKLRTLFKWPQQQHLFLQEPKRKLRLLERPELPSMFSDTSVGDHESEECDTRLATLERDFPRLQQEFLQTKPTLEKRVEALKAKVLLLRKQATRSGCYSDQITNGNVHWPQSQGFNRFCRVEASWTHRSMH